MLSVLTRFMFTSADGLARRPVAHTCGPVLELPWTYASYILNYAPNLTVYWSVKPHMNSALRRLNMVCVWSDCSRSKRQNLEGKYFWTSGQKWVNNVISYISIYLSYLCLLSGVLSVRVTSVIQCLICLRAEGAHVFTAEHIIICQI